MLDVFLATILFACSAVIVGQLGIQSLRIATQSSRERIAESFALSQLNLATAAPESPKSNSEKSVRATLSGNFSALAKIRWISTEVKQLWKVEVQVHELIGDQPREPFIASHWRTVYVPGER